MSRMDDKRETSMVANTGLQSRRTTSDSRLRNSKALARSFESNCQCASDGSLGTTLESCQKPRLASFVQLRSASMNPDWKKRWNLELSRSSVLLAGSHDR